MRVALTVEHCWHEVPGGTARSILDLVAAVARSPHAPDLVGVAARHRNPPLDPWRPPVTVSHHRLPRIALYEAWHATRRPRVESATGPVDVVHATGGAVPGTRAPLVVTVHDLAFLHHPEMFTRQGNRFFRRALSLTAAEASRVIVPSEATAHDCRAAGIGADRLRIVPWGAPAVPRPVGPAGEQAGEQAGERAGRQDGLVRGLGIVRPYVLNVGTVEPRKNLPRLLDAWSRLGASDVDLVLVGPEGWGEAAAAVDERITAMRRAGVDTVHRVGFVDAPTRDALYAGALACCYPSLFEGFGLPVLEAMAHGCPVVTSRGTATEELVADGAGIAVDPHDVDAIAAALRSLVDDADLRHRMAEAGRRRAGCYTWEAAADATVSVYEEACR